MEIYILTKEVGDYNQHGEYFVKAFKKEPTNQELWDLGVPVNRTRHVLNGGGAWDGAHEWFHLHKVKI